MEDPAHHDRLRRICLFDLVANNADRKSGHCLLGEDGQIYAIDNGLCFHQDPKLRTVIWNFAGDTIPGGLLDDLRALLDRGVPAALAALLAPGEVQALRGRAQALIARRRFPADRSGSPLSLAAGLSARGRDRPLPRRVREQPAPF